MIKTSTQLKALVRNRSNSDNGKALLLFRNYAMERFLERISVSKFKDNFILKGGMLVSAFVGLDNRATMDLDATVCSLPLDEDNALRIVREIAEISLDDNIRFEVKDASRIMDEAEYNGVRLTLNAFLDTMRIPLKLDISTGDLITPAQMQYQYQLMFEDRRISIWSYNLETVLAEKIETVLTRGTLNTRLRDFYDLYILQNSDLPLDPEILAAALTATCRHRGSSAVLRNYKKILAEIYGSPAMQKLWQNYQQKNSYAADLSWDAAIAAVLQLCCNAIDRNKNLTPAPSL